jgi:transcriptional regulator with XRE-family HTH domain
MPRTDRRVQPPIGHYQIVRNFRLLRGWTQALAAEWYGVSERTWRRYEAERAAVPKPLLKRIEQWARRSCPEHLHLLS